MQNTDRYVPRYDTRCQRRRRRALVAAALLCLARFKPHAHHVESTAALADMRRSGSFSARTCAWIKRSTKATPAVGDTIESIHFATGGVYAVAIVEETLRPTSPIVRVSHGPQIALLGRAHEMLAGGALSRVASVSDDLRYRPPRASLRWDSSTTLRRGYRSLHNT